MSSSPPPIEMATEPTILPAPVANVVSFTTRSSSAYLRLGTLIGRLALDSGRIATTTSLEVGRTVLERIFFRAGDDIASRSTGEIGRQEAESLLEKSITALHSTITSISFAAATGFYVGSTSLAAGSELAQGLLTALDSIFGSTDSSRAIASIISLVRREFDNPATGQPGETVSVNELLVGISGLALLQRWCRVASEQQAQKEGWKETVWDVVILDDGMRADVVDDNDRSISDTPRDGTVTADVQTVGNTGHALMSNMMDEDGLRGRIMAGLPAEAKVSITAETTTTKTITVEITGAQPPDLPVPDGAEVVEEHAHSGGSFTQASPYYKVVYRTRHTDTRGTDVAAIGPETVLDNTDATDFASRTSEALEYEAPENNQQDLFESSSLSRFEELPADPRRNLAQAAVEPTDSVNLANSKRQRQSSKRRPSFSTGDAVDGHPRNVASPNRLALSKKQQSESSNTSTKSGGKEKKPSLMAAFKKQATFSNILGKDSLSTSSKDPSASSASWSRPAWNSPVHASKASTKQGSRLSPPQPVGKVRPTPLLRRTTDERYNKDLPRPPSQASYYAVHEKRRNSVSSQIDTYSVHSGPSTRAASPTEVRGHVRTHSSLMRSRSEKNFSNVNHLSALSRPHSPEIYTQPPSPVHTYRSRPSHGPTHSIFTLKANGSQASLVLAGHKAGAYNEEESLRRLQRDGFVPGIFPHHHFIRNITCFVRFASATYGSNFMRLMGISATPSGGESIPDPNHHYEHHSFSWHTQLPSSSILLSSFVDPQGGTDASGETGTNVPLVHFVSLDHDSKAVVLSCRGTLGFQDVLTDLTCEFDDMIYNGRSYRVHKGIYASARRLLSGTGSRVVATLAAALGEFPSYGLVLCGHSLGGGVVALLAIMLSTPGSDPESTAFVTAPPSSYPSSPLLLSGSRGRPSSESAAPITLPSGRRIHVYTYGPPATMSSSLRLATRGLITTVINGQDIVPFLSLGTLHDLQAVALAFKTDNSGASSRVRARVWDSMRTGLWEQWYSGSAGYQSTSEEEDIWAWATLKTLRASMQSEKLVPPGECFQVETTRVLQRDAFTPHEKGGRGLGRPATRVTLKYVREVESVFAELRFKGGLLGDHSPGRYENAMKALKQGILGS